MSTPTPYPRLTAQTLRYLEDLVMQQSFSASAPDFRSQVQLAVTALDELDAAITADGSYISDGAVKSSHLDSPNLSLFDYSIGYAR